MVYFEQKGLILKTNIYAKVLDVYSKSDISRMENFC